MASIYHKPSVVFYVKVKSVNKNGTISVKKGKEDNRVIAIQANEDNTQCKIVFKTLTFLNQRSHHMHSDSRSL